jgi:mannose-6-phosphate isomerase-like protein (cupin superfamily)
MQPQQYIESGNLEAWYLGTLNATEAAEFDSMCARFREVQWAREKLEIEMEALANLLALDPRPSVKKRILTHAGFKATLDLAHLPVIDHNTDYLDWLGALDHLIPKAPADDLVFQPLTRTPEFSQSLVFTRMNIPDETHDDLIESFLILEGACRCLVGGKAFLLNAGDFLEIPLHTDHDITLLTPHVLAILQQQRLPAVSSFRF